MGIIETPISNLELNCQAEEVQPKTLDDVVLALDILIDRIEGLNYNVSWILDFLRNR